MGYVWQLYGYGTFFGEGRGESEYWTSNPRKKQKYKADPYLKQVLNTQKAKQRYPIEQADIEGETITNTTKSNDSSKVYPTSLRKF